MNRYLKVISILDQAVGGPSAQVGFHGAFWRNRTRDEFVAHIQFGQQLIVLNDPASSALVRALKAEDPFDGSPFGRMPSGGNPPVPADEIAFIEQWIADGCPEDDLPEEGIGVDATAGMPATDEVCNTYWREFDRWSLFDRTPEVDAAIGSFFGVVPQWLDWAARRGSEADWDAAIQAADTQAAITLLATRQAETVTEHFGNPVPLLTLLDCYDRFGGNRLAPDPERPSEPRHNMNAAIMWFFWSAFADACLRLQIEPTFWRGNLRAILVGMLNDGVFRGRFSVSGFPAGEAARAAISAHVQALAPGDLVAEAARRYRESGLAGPLADDAVARRYSIHPSIGIARLGNSPTAFFIGPESPGRSPLPEGESYRDAEGNIKRQAARFRIYESSFDESGRLVGVREITAAGADIRWTVRMVNRKAAAPTFPPATNARRNDGETDRSRLVIDSGTQTLSGRNARTVMTGAFRGQTITLGEIRTEESGRLVVLGGFGISGFVPPGTAQIQNFANNDGWHDDVSDGPVHATVRLPGGESVEADSAWVIVAPPSYAPDTHNVVTMYDQALNAAVQLDPNLAATLEPVSFTRDIYPILERTVRLQWVSNHARIGHGPGTRGDLLEPSRLQRLADNGPGSSADRMLVFDMLIPPGTPELNRRDNTGRMPRLEDGLDPENPSRRVEMTLTPLQYRHMEEWARGLFTADWPGAAPAAPALEDLPVAEQLRALDRAALDACIGGPFFPGIEAGFLLARLDTYRVPLRIKTTFEPGELKQGNACPWQADFLACSRLWWPAQRPNEVVRGDGAEPVEWTPSDWGWADMLENWANLGFIVKEGERYLEMDRLLPDPAVPVG
jgi:L-Lysine epsilon oxidase N-terminal/L-lysine epsilon oxidase C-terminal domain